MDDSRNSRLAEVPNNGPELSLKTMTRTYSPASTSHTRHQVKRSINEVSSPRLRPSTTREDWPSQPKPKSEPTVTASFAASAAASTAAAVPPGSAPRSSVDVSRSHQAAAASSGTAGAVPISPACLSPNPSRRPSVGHVQLISPDEPPPMPLIPYTTTSLTSKPAVPPSSAADSRDPDGDGASGLGSGNGLQLERMEGLKKTISELGAFSETATRRLDDTYYSVLERLSMLQSTIVAIKDLALLSKQIDHIFQDESNEVVTDASSQLEALGNFEQQQKRIEVLQERILRGRDKINALSHRVDVVGDRIDGWEKADKEWQERTRKRLKIIWFLIMVVLAALCMLFVFTPLPHGSGDGEASAGRKPPVEGLPFLGSEKSGVSTNRTGVNFKTSRTRSDERLRVFDEL